MRIFITSMRWGVLTRKNYLESKAKSMILKKIGILLLNNFRNKRILPREALNAVERPGLLWGMSGALTVDELSRPDYHMNVGNANDQRQIEQRKN